MILKQLLSPYNLILASGSPRRQKFLEELDLEFTIKLKEVEEIYPPELNGSDITEFLCKLKAKPFLAELGVMDILITCDTIVWHEGNALGKPTSKEDAYTMLKSMSGKTHHVYSSVCLSIVGEQICFSEDTEVTFKNLNDEDIWYYINTYHPMDKAGAYGIQEWIGHIGIQQLKGSYNNVVGLPTEKLYDQLTKLVS
ncbi:Maf family nucleotide pyrophosphatase [Aegicerativicinus sediminis]|uniref:Maf family nucleotide pyrophosphatase n=1 Tax=Aegicerativicinus sediminis TaxID=2893202 RepID=UPI00293BE018|nr:Maf family nucleotide pyrophosphatase [Aegicerativicinus sediminis]